jgi:ADP-heptose:LPS heptosyltransferase
VRILKPIVGAKNILVIKHGALGDFILALPAIAAIRAHFPDAHLAIQTTMALVPLCDACPYIDEIDPDGRPKGARAMLALASRVRGERYEVIYDLQNSERTAFLHLLLGPFRPHWSGIAGGASHRVRDPHRLHKHAIDRMAEQLALTGVPAVSAQGLPDLAWAAARGAPPDSFGIEGPFLMIAARASAGRAVKQWPADRFAAVARRALAGGVTPVLVGAEDDRAALADIATLAPGALNLGGRTSLLDLAALGARAQGALGNDTGPVFIAAAAGAPTAVFYSRHSLSPDICAPRGPRGVIALKGRELTDISVEAAEQALAMLGALKR